MPITPFITYTLNIIDGILDEVKLVDKTSVETPLLFGVLDHDVVVKDDEPVGVEVEEAVEEESNGNLHYR